MSRFRKWLFTGLLVIVPGAITLSVLNWIVALLDQTLLILPGAWHPDKLLGFHIPGFGVLLTALILLAVGATASNFAGRKLVQWPREGVWTVAFVTGAPSGEVAAYLRDEFVSVYVPTTPNPTGGYFVMLRKSECIELEMSVDAALRYIVSMGVVAPSDPVLVAAAAR